MKEILENLKNDDPTFSFLRFYDGLEDDVTKLNRAEVGKSFYDLGKLHYDKSDLIKAEENFIKALTCTKKSQDHYTILKALGFLIRIASERLEGEKAQRYIKLSKDLVDDLTRKLTTLGGEYFYNMGVVHNYLGEFEDANNNFVLAYKKSKEENEPELLAKCLLSMATNAYYSRKFKESLVYIGQLDELLKIINKSYLLGSMYLLLGKIYIELGENNRALANFRQANIILQEKKCWNLFPYVLLGKGITYKNMGEYNNALLFFQLAIDNTDARMFKRVFNLLKSEVEDVNDSSVDLYLDKTNRKVREKTIGIIDFKHRFILLEILFLLARKPGLSFDKEQLARSIWKDEYNPLIHDKLIYTSVSRLRKLIEPKNIRDEKRKYILRGKDGYTFNPQAKIRFHMENKVTFAKTIANVDISSPV